MCDLFECKDCGKWTPNNLIYCKEVKDLWLEFGDLPMNPDTECIEVEWHGFEEGTHREEIWHWFEEKFNVRVYDLIYSIDEC